MPEREPKTLFEHLGLKNDGNGLLSQLPSWATNTIRFMAIGLVIGFILDLVLNYDKFTIVIPLIMLIIIILKKNRGP